MMHSKKGRGTPNPWLSTFFSFVLVFSMVPTTQALAVTTSETDTANEQAVGEVTDRTTGVSEAVPSALAEKQADSLSESEDVKTTTAVPQEDAYGFAGEQSDSNAPPAKAIEMQPAADVSADVWDGAVDVSWYDATATSFTLDKPAQLAGLAAITNGTAKTADGIAITRDTFAGKKVALGADITLNMSAATKRTEGLLNWTPIADVNTSDGSSSTVDVFFDGIFDGQGHVIKNLYLDGNVTASSNFGGYQGLFGALGSNATITNVGIDGGYLYGRVAGGIAAISHVASATQVPHIVGCFNKATIEGNGSSTRGAGGIFGGEDSIGSHEETSTSGFRAACYIANCYNAGTIRGAQGGPAGGIAGTGMIQMYACYNAGTISSLGTYQGALVGNVYAAGYETAAGFVANGTVHDSYALVDTCKNLYRTLDATHGKDNASTEFNADDSGFLTEFQMTGSGASAVLSGSFVDSNSYPVLYWQKGESTADLNAAQAKVGTIGFQRYTGKPIEPAVTVSIPDPDPYGYGDIVLHQGSDFTVVYTNNVDTGTATATVHGFGRYTGILEAVTFSIVDADLSKCVVDPIDAQWFYDSPVKPTIVVKTSSGATLTEGIDYMVSYTNNDKAGTASVKVTAVEGSSSYGETAATFAVIAASTSLNGSGTPEDPYKLSSKADLQFLAHQINVKADAAYAKAAYEVVNDIDASALDANDRAADTIGIGGWSNPGFGGTIDGGGHTITLGLNDNSLSSEISSTGWGDSLAFINKTSGSSNSDNVIIKDLTLAGSVTCSGPAAAFVGSANCASITFENCTNKAGVFAGPQYGNSAAGFVGGTGASTAATFKNCENTGSIASGTQAGGFVYSLAGGANTFENCKNSGTITAKGHAGGLVADFKPSASSKTSCIVMTGCSNSGAVTTTGENPAGGLIGYNQEKAPLPCTIAKCFNTGHISGGGYGGYVGGLIGQAYDTTFNLINVYNRGTVTETDPNESARSGGLVGTYSCNTVGSGSLNITNAYNTGTIESANADYPGGGLLGYVFFRASVTLENCYFESQSATTDIGGKSEASGYLPAPTVNGHAASTDAASMKSDEFVSMLGAAFDKDTSSTNEGYPVLSDRQVSSISDCAVSDIPAQKYTGADLRPAINVIGADGKKLIEGIDYVVFYHVRDGSGEATIIGIGAWQGSQTKSYALEKCDISADCLVNVSHSLDYATNPGGTFTSEVSVTNPAGGLLVENVDYDVSYYGNDKAGTAMILIKGIGSYYTGSTIQLVTIKPAALETTALTDMQSAYEYSRYGAWVSPTLTASNGYKLNKGTDYDMTFEQADGQAVSKITAGGQYEVVLTGKGNWSGQVKAPFKYGSDLASDAILTDVETAYPYSGQAIAITPTVKKAADGTALVAGEDYTVAYLDADGKAVSEIKDPGTYEVAITSTGTGEWYGSMKASFKIAVPEFYLGADSVSGINDSYPYTGRVVVPNPAVKIGDKVLREGINYTVSYLDASGTTVETPIAAGTYTAVVTGIGNYSGTVRKSFTIEKPYFTLYTQEGENGTPKIAKTYTQAEFEALKSDSTQPVSGLYYKDETWMVTTAATYVTLNDLFDDAKVSDVWKSGAKLAYGGDASQGKAQQVYEYDKFTGMDMFYPGSIGSDTSLDGAHQVPAVLSLTEASGKTTANDNAGAVEKANATNANATNTPRIIFGVNDKDYESKQNVGGMRYWSRNDSLTIITPGQPLGWTRLAGETALDTMKGIVESDKGFSEKGGTVVVATTSGYWDALTASGLAGLSNAPVLMTDGSVLSDQTKDEITRLAPSKVIVCGGQLSVSQDVMESIQDMTGVVPDRFAGQNAAETACALYAGGSGWGSTCIVATVNSFQDALSIAPYAYAKHCPIFLTESDGTLSDNTAAVIKGGGFKNAVIVGGTTSVSSSVESDLALIGLEPTAIERLSGETALETSHEIAVWELSHGMSADGMGVATVDSYYDALCGASLCGKNATVIVLVSKTDVKAAEGAIGAAKSHNAPSTGGYVFGGETSVSSDAFDRLTKLTS